MNLLLFDIDGTLINTGGAAIKAAELAFENIYNVANVMNGIRADGKTDPLILKEMFIKGLNRDYSLKEAEIIFEEYIKILNTRLSNSEKLEVLPGIYELLDELSDQKDIILGLATGNIEQGAWIKLRHSDLDGYFSFGGFGSDSENREQLIRIAIDRAENITGNKIEKIYVIGDTPLDIVAGRAAGALTVGVCTGVYNYAQLESHNPDFLFNNLLDTHSFINIL
jgi:phosphoglycolate phosphatase-like HAD superfamily hydrolase